jgi:hypothetical protein
MTKILSQSFILCMAVAIVSISFLGLEAKAEESVSTNSFFFEESDCRVLEGRSKRLCLLHCEFLECDDPESLGLGPFLSFFHERTCNRLLDKYEQETGYPGPNCFCGQACGLKFEECLEACDPDDPCCPVDCQNSRSSCNASCCFQKVDIDYNLCLENCNGDPDCELGCEIGGCGISFQTCFIPAPLP